MLCSVCQKTLSSVFVYTKYVSHHTSTQGLMNATQDGCFVCSALWHHYFGIFARVGTLGTNIGPGSFSRSLRSWQGVEDDASSDIPRFENEPLTSTSSDSHVDMNHCATRFKVTLSEYNMYCISVWLYGAEMWEELFYLIPWNDVVGLLPDLGSLLDQNLDRDVIRYSKRELVELAKTWLYECQGGHSDCAQDTRSKVWYPNRLIKLQRFPSTARLIETSETQPKDRYATLSHRWGRLRDREKAFICTQDNINVLKSRVPISQLPKTFREAIELAASLDIRYLWIDSLCILQDDEGDWLREAATMDQVYANAVVNISATGARHSDEGLFFEMQESIASPCTTEIRQGYAQDRCLILNAMLLFEEIDRAPLNERAWVLQERLLAPRVLHFGRRQLLWECNTCSRCQQFPGGLPQGLPSQDGEVRRCEAGLNGKNPSSRFQTWLTLVERYSHCTLTFADDKLVAFSALARSFSDVLGKEYYAGVFRHGIHRQLLWRSEELSKSVSKPHDYRAPSWSWAAIDGAVSFPADVYQSKDDQLIKLDELLDLVDGRSETLNDDPFGHCLFSRLVVLGRLCPVKIKPVNMFFSPVRFDFEFLQNLGPACDYKSFIPDIPIEEYEFSDFASSHHKVFFVPLLFREAYVLSDVRSASHLMGIVVERSGPRRAVYRRLGFAEVLFKKDSPRRVDELDLACPKTRFDLV